MATLTATADSANGVVILALAGSAETTATVLRIDGAGNRVAVRNGDPAPTPSGSWDGLDYEAPLDTSVSYEAVNVTTSAVLATSGAVSLTSDERPWLGHPGVPSRNIRPVVADFKPGTRLARSTTLQAIGRARPIAQSLRRTSLSGGALMIRTSTFAELQAVHDLIDDGHVLLLRGPAAWGGYGTRYVQIGDVEFEPLTRVGAESRYLITMPFTEVDRPAGLAQSGTGYRWVDVTTAYASWTDLATANPTWNDVIAGVT